MTPQSALLAERLDAVKRRMRRAAREAGRDPGTVRLIAVSKLHPASAVAALARCGQIAFGENYLEEAMEKRADAVLQNRPLEWHFIGHLQSRKAREAAGQFALVHTIDALHTARRLQRALEESDRVQDVLIQVNIGGERQKSGVDEDGLAALARGVAGLARLRLLGLMCIPPLCGGASASRPHFQRLRLLRDRLSDTLGMELPHLSMGMSMDFEAAIAEGATLIRVGTEIFGPRA